jgi:acetyl-CoA acetyltransferase
MVRNGDITYGGKGVVINPSGGLISKGNPLGATGPRHAAPQHALHHSQGLLSLSNASMVLMVAVL